MAINSIVNREQGLSVRGKLNTLIANNNNLFIATDNSVVANGVTDCITVLQSLVNSCAAANKTVNIPDGTFLISTTLYIPSNSKIIFGDNAILKTNNDINLIEFTGNNIDVYGGTFDVSGVTNYTKTALYFGLNNTYFINVYDPKIIGDVVISPTLGGKGIFINKPSGAYYGMAINILNLYIYGFGIGIDLFSITTTENTYPWITACKFTGKIWESSQALNIADGYVNGCQFDLITETGTNTDFHIKIAGNAHILKVNPYDVGGKCILVTGDHNTIEIFGQVNQWIEDYGLMNTINAVGFDKFRGYSNFLNKPFTLGLNSAFVGESDVYERVIEDGKYCHKLTTSSLISVFEQNKLADYISSEVRKIVVTMRVKCSNANSITYLLGLDAVSKYERGFFAKTVSKHRITFIDGNNITLDNVDGISEGNYLWIFSQQFKNYITNIADYPLKSSLAQLLITAIDSVNKIVTVSNLYSTTLLVGTELGKIIDDDYYYRETNAGIYNTWTELTFTFDLGNFSKHNLLGYKLRLELDSGANTDEKIVYIDSEIKVDLFCDLPKIATQSVYENNILALAGGLTIGDNYRTSTGILMVVA